MRLTSLVVMIAAGAIACSKSDGGDSKPAGTVATQVPATAPVASAALNPAPVAAAPTEPTAPPAPTAPPGRPGPTKDEVREAMTSVTTTSTSQFMCYRNGSWQASIQLSPDEIKSVKIVDSKVDGDHAVVKAKIVAEHKDKYVPAKITGTVKLRYRWEAEWRLTERDSHGATCEL